LINDRQASGGKRGWKISLDDVIRWASSYGIDPSRITGLNITSYISAGTAGFAGTAGTGSKAVKPSIWQGEL
jgi:branched-subunit amino acid ABC-type transport system permease component